MNDDISALRGQFVVEVGIRQAWLFLTFCDNAQTPHEETRLYIDTYFRLGAGPALLSDSDPGLAVGALAELTNRTATAVAIGDDGALTIEFDGGEQSLCVTSEGSPHTIHDIWWLGGPS